MTLFDRLVADRQQLAVIGVRLQNLMIERPDLAQQVSDARKILDLAWDAVDDIVMSM